jgi:hypothetical protein
MALVRTVMRVHVLLILDGGKIRIREIVERLYRVGTHAEPMWKAITGQIRASPAVQAEENGSVWGACTPALQSADDDHLRAGETVTAVSGPDVAGVLCSDVSAGSSTCQGLHQRW